MLVLDASVLVKLFRAEPDSHLAHEMVLHTLERDVPMVTPSIALYEVLAISLHYDVPFDIPLTLFSQMRRTGFRFVEPTSGELARAETIATTRNPSSGLPFLEDSIYHAVAIHRGGQFVTADLKHIRKAGHLGNVVSLAEWRAG